MMVMTVPWHWLGLEGQWRRVAHFDYADPAIAGWAPWVDASVVGGVVLLVSAAMFVANLLAFHGGATVALKAIPRQRYAIAAHPPVRVPAMFNGFGMWNVVVLVLMLCAYGYPIAQSFILPAPQANVHRVSGAG
jgi:cytochrome c oxidase subunit I